MMDGLFRALFVFILLASLGQLSACSTREMYGAGQGWQRNECGKILDSQERSDCMENANTSYEEHQQQQKRDD